MHVALRGKVFSLAPPPSHIFYFQVIPLASKASINCLSHWKVKICDFTKVYCLISAYKIQHL